MKDPKAFYDCLATIVAAGIEKGSGVYKIDYVDRYIDAVGTALLKLEQDEAGVEQNSPSLSEARRAAGK